MATELLDVRGLTAGYGEAVVVQGIDLKLAPGESVALLGRNGTGKTTFLNSLVGVTRHHGGSIRLGGVDVTSYAPHQRAAAGIGWVPQERNIFKSLTVEENLTAVARPGPWTVARAYEMFPRLAERRGNLGTQLSGGEQQMLAVARALVLNPKLLLLDEPVAGVPEGERQEILDTINALPDDVSVLLIEHDMDLVFNFARTVSVLVNGAVFAEGDVETISNDDTVKAVYLGRGDGHGH